MLLLKSDHSIKVIFNGKKKKLEGCPWAITGHRLCRKDALWWTFIAYGVTLLGYDSVPSHLALPMALFPGSRKPCPSCSVQITEQPAQHWSDRPEFAFPPATRKLAPWCLAWPPGPGLRRPPLGRIQGGRESLNLQNSEPAGHRQPLWNVRRGSPSPSGQHDSDIS